MSKTTNRRDFLASTGDLALLNQLGLTSDIMSGRDWTHLGIVELDHTSMIEVERI